METNAGEADDARFVYIPLLIMEELSASLRHSAEKRVNRRRAAPFQVVVAMFDYAFPEARRVALLHALDTSSSRSPGPISGDPGGALLIDCSRPRLPAATEILTSAE